MATDPNPLTYTCTCSCLTSEPGTVLLFYRYFAAPPALPSTVEVSPTSLADLQAFHSAQVTALSLSCKIRLSQEGFNITVGGTRDAIASYVSACLTHWSFTGLLLSTSQQQDAFFKPTPGCACVFSGRQDVLIKSEITPLGVTGWLPQDWASVKELSPEEWHRRAAAEDGVVMIDMRNHYESRLGHFVGRNGKPAIRPAVRRFGQWPAYAKKMVAEGGALADAQGAKGKSVFTYCTGGIRCEKGSRWLAQEIGRTGQNVTEVYTLRGGIAAYLTWVDSEIAAGRMQASNSLFKGRNFVFDARGSLGLEAGEKVAICHGCGTAADSMRKCASPGCYLVLIVCEECENKNGEGIRCCEDCWVMDLQQSDGNRQQQRRMCECEKAREEQLWGSEKTNKLQGWKTKKRKEHEHLGKTGTLDIRVKIKGSS